MHPLFPTLLNQILIQFLIHIHLSIHRLLTFSPISYYLLPIFFMVKIKDRMMKRSTTTSKRSNPQIQSVIDWEVRPGGMLVQKRLSGSDPGCDSAQIINIKVSHDSCYHHVALPSNSTFVDLKKILARMTNLEVKDQRLLFRGKEKGDDECLDMAGVKDMSKVMLLEDPASKERKLISKKNANAYVFDAIMEVRTEVDKLSHKVAAMETSAKNGIKIAVKEIEVMTELLMKELLKLDGIEAEGDAKSQRRAEVRRVKGFVDILDSLKLTMSEKQFDQTAASAVSLMTKWETFDSGIGSLNAPNRVQNSTKITHDWEQFE